MKNLKLLLLFHLLPFFSYAQEVHLQKEEYREITFYQTAKKDLVVLNDNGESVISEQPVTTTMAYINKMAKEGWILVTAYNTVVTGSTVYYVYILKRTIK